MNKKLVQLIGVPGHKITITYKCRHPECEYEWKVHVKTPLNPNVFELKDGYLTLKQETVDKMKCRTCKQHGLDINLNQQEEKLIETNNGVRK